MGILAPKTIPLLCSTMALPKGLLVAVVIGALAREPNVSSKVMALMFKVARIASLSARLESSLVDGTCRSHIETLIALTTVCSYLMKYFPCILLSFKATFKGLVSIDSKTQFDNSDLMDLRAPKMLIVSFHHFITFIKSNLCREDDAHINHI